jgi:hypothetical protein
MDVWMGMDMGVVVGGGVDMGVGVGAGETDCENVHTLKSTPH